MNYEKTLTILLVLLLGAVAILAVIECGKKPDTLFFPVMQKSSAPAGAAGRP